MLGGSSIRAPRQVDKPRHLRSDDLQLSAANQPPHSWLHQLVARMQVDEELQPMQLVARPQGQLVMHEAARGLRPHDAARAHHDIIPE
jgi:hypothetical protein